VIGLPAKHQTAGYSASSISKRAHAIAQDSRRDPRNSMLEKLIQQKEERVADLETLRTRRD
jgi:hypothetical protein